MYRPLVFLTRFLAVCFLASAPSANAQRGKSPERVTPRSVAARGLPVRADTMDGWVGEGRNRQLYGTYAHQVARVTIAGRATYLITMNYVGGGAFQSDTLALDATTLAPLWRRFHGRTDSVLVQFDGQHAKGVALQNKNGRITALPVDHKIADGAFPGNIYRWFIGKLPLAVGYSASFASFSTLKNTEDTTTITVSETVVLKIGERQVDTWLVKTSTGSELWIDKATGVIIQEHDAAAFSANGAWNIKR